MTEYMSKYNILYIYIVFCISSKSSAQKIMDDQH